jgi:hypothetical protein
MVLLITMNVMWEEAAGFIPARIWLWIPYFLMINTILYANRYLLVPGFLLRGKTWQYILSFPLLIIFAVVGLELLQLAAPGNGPQHTPPLLDVVSGLAAFILFVFGLTALQLFRYRIDNQRKINALESVTMEIELANLQNQINPHFLFNMLNNANIMAGEDTGKSSFILSKLNDLLHYQIEGSSKKTVRLCEEIAFLEDFLALEKTRRDRFTYAIHSEGDCNVEAPPLLFIPFVENAVKHNPENDSFVTIVFRMEEERLYFRCENPKPKSFHIKKQGGIGLINSRKRLDLLFGRDYTLDLRDEKDRYIVIMNVKI